MAFVFTYGTLCHPPLMRIVAGEDAVARPARLPGFAAKQAGDADFPALIATPGAVAEGGLWEVGETALERLDWYEAIYGYPAGLREVETDDGPRTARVWLPGEGQAHEAADWRLDDWAPKWGPLLCHAAAEAMELFGQVPPERVGRFWESYMVRAASRLRAEAMPAPVVGTAMTRDKVETLETTLSHEGFFLTRADKVRHETFDGGQTGVLDREVFVMGDACVVLPYDPVRDRILLTEQFRLGPWRRGATYPWVLEPVAGRIDPGETPEETARRECVEEAGTELGELLPVAHYYPSTGAVSEYIYTYVGLCDLPDLPEGGGGMAEEGEDIRTHLLSFDEAMDLVSRGEANDGPLILLLLWLERERPRLRATA